MATINASTTIKVKKTTVKSKKAAGVSKKGGTKKATKRGEAPLLKPRANTLGVVQDKKEWIANALSSTLGEETVLNKSKPRAASTTKTRGTAAADLALAASEWGIVYCLKECSVLETMKNTLFPEGGGLENLFVSCNSSLGSSSHDDSAGTDGKRGKTTPPNAREGCLLLIRALCERLGHAIEPYVVVFLPAALDECGSSSFAVREAAQDTATALVAVANPWSFSKLLCPMLMHSLTTSTEWRVKHVALERLEQCASTTAPLQVNALLPDLIPQITSQVWDTKAQVTKAAASTLMAACLTCRNADVKPAIPAVVHAICKPADTNKAVEELMGTTFVVAVDAPTLSVLCPVLARALKEKLAIHKRAACLVIKNMSRLVESPAAVAPFGPLLVPELKKVANNVQFEEIRDAALSALQNLTKALGENDNDIMDREQERVAAEQKRIEEARKSTEAKETAMRQREEEEKKKFKEAMDAQRELDRIAEQNAKQDKIDEMKKKDKAMRSTKGATGKCQACGLKRCKKTCVFSGKK